MSEESKTKSKTSSRSYVDAARKNKKGEGETDESQPVEQQVVETTEATSAETVDNVKPQRRTRKTKTESSDTQTSERNDNEEHHQYDNRRPRNYDRQDNQPYHTDDALDQMSREELVETVKKQDRIISAMKRRNGQTSNRYYNNGPRNNDGYYRQDRQDRQPRNYDRQDTNDNQEYRPRGYYRQDRQDRQDSRDRNTRPSGRPGYDSEYTPERFRERFPNRHMLNNDRQDQAEEN